MVIDTHGGSLLRVRVIPRAGRSIVVGSRSGALLVRLAAAPVDGAANEELVAIVARTLHIPRSQLTIHSGLHARDKRLLVEGLPSSELRKRLQELLGRS